MMASDQWEFADTGSVRIPDDAPLGSFEQALPNWMTGEATAAAPAATAAPSTTANWINAIAQVAQAGSQVYATYATTKAAAKAPKTQTVYVQQPQLAPVSAAIPWGTISLIGGGVLVVGVVAYLLLK